MQRLRVAHRGDAREPHLALIAQPLECRCDLLQHDPRRQRFTAAARRYRVVQMEDVDLLAPHALQACLERLDHRLGDAAKRCGRDANLGADHHIRLQLRQHATQVLFRLTVAVHCRGVEVVYPGLERARHSAFLIRRRAAHHQSAHRAATKAQDRDLQSGPSECPHFHCHILPVVTADTAPPPAPAPWPSPPADRASASPRPPCAPVPAAHRRCRRSPSAGPSSRSCRMLGL